MITADYIRLMARYNLWQNGSMFAAADQIGDAARRLERGAFFGSIHGTLSHLYWGDAMWMSRFGGFLKPEAGIPQSALFVADWTRLVALRAEMDRFIKEWAERVDPEWLAGSLTWHSASVGREVSRPVAMLVTHMFNHQTHHRGQVHAMLTAAGAKAYVTDLAFMPD